jgi:hypothetical protein
MSSNTCKTLFSKLAKRNKKKEGKFVRMKIKGQQTTHEGKMPNATCTSPKRRISSKCAMS